MLSRSKRRGPVTITVMAGLLSELLGRLWALVSLLWHAVAARIGNGPAKAPSAGSSRRAEARRQRRRQAAKAAPGAAAVPEPAAAPGKATPGGAAPQAAAAPKPAPSAPAATARPAGAAPPSDTTESEEEPEVAQQPSWAAAAMPNSWAALTAASVKAEEAQWEVARSRRAPQKGAATMHGGGSASGKPGAATSKSAAATAQGQRRRGEVRVCERPDCGAEGRGFRKCARCGRVAYCTPACMASDWERHQVQCC